MARHRIVLLLARDGLTRSVTSGGLSMYGYEVLTATDGEQAAELLKAHRHITTVVIDADVGGKVDGIAVGRLARELNPRVDVIYTSRMPHRILPLATVSGAPILRDPYHPHQLVGVMTSLRQRSTEPLDQSAA